MCGILGISNRNDHVFAELYDGLLMLQHRGQDASGMVTYNGEFFREKKANGLVKDVFDAAEAETLLGKVGIGHVRYPTAGSLSASEAQPFFVNAPYGIYLVHNGNITNTEEQRSKVTGKYSRHLRTTSDSEIMLNVLADKVADAIKVNGNDDPIRNIFAGVKMMMERIQGAYSVITMIAGVGLLAFRDPHGIRPLSVAQRDAGKNFRVLAAAVHLADAPDRHRCAINFEMQHGSSRHRRSLAVDAPCFPMRGYHVIQLFEFVEKGVDTCASRKKIQVRTRAMMPVRLQCGAATKRHLVQVDQCFEHCRCSFNDLGWLRMNAEGGHVHLGKCKRRVNYSRRLLATLMLWAIPRHILEATHGARETI